MVLGSQSPPAELQSLRDSSRIIARTKPPSILFYRSDDGETVSCGSLMLTMEKFRKLPDYFMIRAEEICASLLFGLQPDINLAMVKDDMINSRSGYSFVKNTDNGLESAHLLFARAYTSSKNGLARRGHWN